MTNQKKYYHGAFTLIWIALGLVCFFSAFQTMKMDVNYFKRFDLAGYLFISFFAVLFILTGVSFFKRWPFSRILNVISGLIIWFYSLVVLIFGVEDVGGLFVGVPLSLAGIAFGVWSILIKRE